MDTTSNHSSAPANPTLPATVFSDRRVGDDLGSQERRQFGSSYTSLSESGQELAKAIDQYKVENHRRYITCDEMLSVIQSLGYAKQQ